LIAYSPGRRGWHVSGGGSPSWRSRTRARELRRRCSIPPARRLSGSQAPRVRGLRRIRTNPRSSLAVRLSQGPTSRLRRTLRELLPRECPRRAPCRFRHLATGTEGLRPTGLQTVSSLCLQLLELPADLDCDAMPRLAVDDVVPHSRLDLLGRHGGDLVRLLDHRIDDEHLGQGAVTAVVHQLRQELLVSQPRMAHALILSHRSSIASSSSTGCSPPLVAISSISKGRVYARCRRRSPARTVSRSAADSGWKNLTSCSRSAMPAAPSCRSARRPLRS